MTSTVIDRVPLESIQTIEQAVLSKRFTHESIKRLQHAAKKHCWSYIFDQQTDSNEILVGVIDIKRNANFRLTGDPEHPIQFLGFDVVQRAARDKQLFCMIQNPIASLCEVCWRSVSVTKRCGQCGIASYCSRECQRAHWSTHKTWCKCASELKNTEPTKYAYKIRYFGDNRGLDAWITENIQHPERQEMCPQAVIVK